jgi:Flagellar FliJ protein
MKQRPDAALEVALEQRQRVLDQERQVLAERELAVQEQAPLLQAAEARVRMVLMQIDAAQRPSPGVSLAVGVLGDLERMLDWCEVQVAVQKERLDIACGEADAARGGVAVAHQQVRALELVLEARAAERAEKQRRAELRLADETAARVHSRRMVAR